MRWLLTSWGSRGDLHPFLALGRGLMARGHAVTLVGHPDWAAETALAGLRFVATDEPPRGDFLRRHPEILSRRWGGLTSLRALVRNAIAPAFEPTLSALRAEAPAHDAIVAHHFVFPAPLAAELEQRPWVTVSLAPGVVPSAFTRPGPDSGAAAEGRLARRKNSFIWECGRRLAGLEIDPLVNRLRARHGLAPVRDAMFSAPTARLNLQLYSGLFAARPPDWPAAVQSGGFCFYDPAAPAHLPAEVEQFLAAGERPVLFTLGSVAVDLPGDFFETAGEALKRLGWRGILLVGREENRPRELSRDVLAVPYLPFGLIMPRVRAVVHQAGIGTLAEVLRAGLPSVAVPFAFDQPNNARRVEELGLGKMLGPRERSVEDFVAALRFVLTDRIVTRARQFGDNLRAEDGVGRSCEVLESAFAPAGGGK